MKACRVCGGPVPDEVRGRPWQRRVCVACHNSRERELYAERRLACPPPSRPLVGDPVRYLLAAVLERAVLDLAAFGRPLSERWQRELDDGVSCDPVGCDGDARDALGWLTGYGEDWCELLDVPREWAREVTDERMMAQQEALSA